MLVVLIIAASTFLSGSLRQLWRKNPAGLAATIGGMLLGNFLYDRIGGLLFYPKFVLMISCALALGVMFTGPEQQP